MADADELATRVQELEIKYTEQQRLLEELSDVLVGQQRSIDAMTRRLRYLEDKVAAAPGLVERGDDEPPPHY